jgi:hypothetical protein
MSTAMPTTTLGGIALSVHLAADTGMRATIVTNDGGLGPLLLEDLKSEITGLTGIEVTILNEQTNASDLVRAIENCPAESAVIVAASDGLPEREWRHLDLLRSRLERPGPLLFVLAPPEARALASGAPNLLSWFGTSFELLSPSQ